LHDIGETQRWTEAGSVGEVSAEKWTDDGAQSEHHPVFRPGVQALAQAASNEVDQENHVWHEAEGIEGILGVKRPQTRRWVRVVGDVMSCGGVGVLARPTGPGDERQD